MKDCVFLVADKDMEATFLGFLTRDRLDRRLGVRAFSFDVVVESRKDPGVYNYGHNLLIPYQRTHQYAVVVLDQAWDGAPAALKIQEDIKSNLMKSGWSDNTCEVIVIEPELEAWIWQDSPHVETAFRFNQVGHGQSLRQWLQANDLWPADKSKPIDPKEAVEKALRMSRTPWSSAIFRQITSRISVQNCQDPAFQKLRDTLQCWFPVQE